MLWLSCPVSPTRDVGVLCQVSLPAPYATGDKIWFKRKTRALLHEFGKGGGKPDVTRMHFRGGADPKRKAQLTPVPQQTECLCLSSSKQPILGDAVFLGIGQASAKQAAPRHTRKTPSSIYNRGRNTSGKKPVHVSKDRKCPDADSGLRRPQPQNWARKLQSPKLPWRPCCLLGWVDKTTTTFFFPLSRGM